MLPTIIKTWKIILSLIALFYFTNSILTTAYAKESVKILYLIDNSGSMYPGYQPGEKYEGKKRYYYIEDDDFKRKLTKFIYDTSHTESEDFSIESVDLSIFHEELIPKIENESPQNFSEKSIRGILDEIKISDTPGRRKNTYLAKIMNQVSGEFRGIVWLVTDNFFEDKDHNFDEQVVDFYKYELNQPVETSPYKIAFIYPLPWEIRDYSSTLAVYGFLLNYPGLDQKKFSRFENEIFKKPYVVNHFEGNSYLKLKPLHINSVIIEQQEGKKWLETEIIPSKVFKENVDLIEKKIRLTVRSNLTHHKVKNGTITARIENNFESTVKGRKEKAPDFTPDDFQPIELYEEGREGLKKISELTEKGIPIPPLEPEESKTYILKLKTKKPISFDQTGSYLSKALSPWTVTYKGDMIFAIKDLKFEVIADSKRVKDVYQAQKISNIFKGEETVKIDPFPVDLEFSVKAGLDRMIYLILWSFLLMIIAGILFWLFMRPASYEVALSGSVNTSERYRLRPLQKGKLHIMHPDHGDKTLLGTIGRGMAGSAIFRAVRGLKTTRPRGPEEAYKISGKGLSLEMLITRLGTKTRGISRRKDKKRAASRRNKQKVERKKIVRKRRKK